MKKILLVDDEKNILTTISLLLENEGYDVKPVIDGVKAMDAAHEFEPDLILLDVKIPKMNGFLVCEALKDDEKTEDIPIIFISAKAEEEDIKKGLDLGAEDYIVKPIDPDDLLKRISKYLQ